jgi:hypothetical protein
MNNKTTINNEKREGRLDERYVRWEKIRIEQLGYVNYILLILSSGIFAFLIDIKINNEIQYINQLYLIHSIIFIVISLIIGVLLAFNRLLSFKWTAKKIRKEQNKEFAHMHFYKIAYELADRVTWILLSLQIIFFLIGVYILLIFTISN